MPALLEHAYGNANLEPMTDDDLRRKCPAAFATAPSADVSKRYGFVNTAELVRAMRDNGFVPTQCNSYGRRDEQARGFTKHMLRFRPAGDVKKAKKGDVVPQIILVNSHDRSSQFHLYAGLWRFICANGLMVSDGPRVEPMVVRHTTSAVDGLLDATGKLIKQQKFVFEHVDAMRETILTDSQALQFAVAALGLRPERAGSIAPDQLLNVRRPDDAGNSLWLVYNRVQEAMMRGGQTGVTGNNRAIVTRGVTSVNADLALNIGMWRIALQAIDKAKASAAKVPAKTASSKAARGKAAAKPVEGNEGTNTAIDVPAGVIEAEGIQG